MQWVLFIEEVPQPICWLTCPRIELAYLCPRIELFQLDLLCTGWPVAGGCIELAAKDNCQAGCCIFHQQTAITASKRHCNALSRSGLRRLKMGCEQAGRVSIPSQPTCFATATNRIHNSRQKQEMKTYDMGHQTLKFWMHF